MEIHGHIQNGAAIPDDLVALPDGAKVTIVVNDRGTCAADIMSDEELTHYRLALAELDAIPNENPGDSFSGANHDQTLYGGDG